MLGEHMRRIGAVADAVRDESRAREPAPGVGRTVVVPATPERPEPEPEPAEPADE
jgi:hypothetical protein